MNQKKEQKQKGLPPDLLSVLAFGTMLMNYQTDFLMKDKTKKPKK